jgi:DNA-binding NarL/FixJ family response regulator
LDPGPRVDMIPRPKRDGGRRGLRQRNITLEAQQNYPGIAVVTPRQAPIRVLIVEQCRVLSSEARSALADDAGFEIVGETTSVAEAMRVARNQRPHLALCEASLPESGAFELARFLRLRLPSTTLVYITQAKSEEQLFEAVRVGAAAYLLGTLETPAFIASLARVARGEFPIDEDVVTQPSVASRVLSLFRLRSAVHVLPGRKVHEAAGLRPFPQASPSHDAFTPVTLPLSTREVEILDLAARGNSNKLIARTLGISDQTVKNHITTILRKLGANDRTEAVVLALRNGWIRMDTPLTPGRPPVALEYQRARRTGRVGTSEYGRPAQASS